MLTFGVAVRPLHGQAKAGDDCLVKVFAHGALVAVVDGLGHGEEAAAAAAKVVATLDDSIPQLVKRCHERLLGTRGAVMSLAWFHAAEGTMTWAGVGNIEGMLLCRTADAGCVRERLLARAGVVGEHLPALRASSFPIAPGDTLIVTTDGIEGGVAEQVRVDGSPQKTADRILAAHARDTDDALVLVARYVGGPGHGGHERARS